MKTFTKSFGTLFFILFSIIFSLNHANANVIYVHHNANGTGDGSSWTNAMVNLQDAIDMAVKSDTICVAAGIYFPTKKFNGDFDQNLTFYINKDIVLLGGFSGDAGTEGDFESRNPDVHLTCLSGDIGVTHDTLDNVFHVVYIDKVSDTMQLDGFIISDAYGFLGDGLQNTGGGIFINGEAGRCSPVIKYCTFRNNNVKENGGGVTVYGTAGGILKPKFIGCRFYNNAGSGGGGYSGYVDTDGEESPVFISCEFKGNTARSSQGAAVSNVTHSSISNHLFVNCIITGNHAPSSQALNYFTTGTGIASPVIVNSTIAGNSGGSIRLSDLGSQASSVIVTNSILWNNPTFHGLSTSGLTQTVSHTIGSGFLEGVGNLDIDPEFVETPTADHVPHTDGDVHLSGNSPGIDAGSNAAVPVEINTDADAKPRFINPVNGQDGLVDMGAYEVQPFSVSTQNILKANAIRIFPNPVTDLLQIEMENENLKGYMMITNSLGQVLRFIGLDDKQELSSIDVTKWAEGIYFLSMLSRNTYDVEFFVISR